MKGRCLKFIGENRYLIPVKLKGPVFGEISFNWRYLVDGLKPLKGEYFIFGISGDNKPAILRSSDNASFFHILMPVKAV